MLAVKTQFYCTRDFFSRGTHVWRLRTRPRSFAPTASHGMHNRGRYYINSSRTAWVRGFVYGARRRSSTCGAVLLWRETPGKLLVYGNALLPMLLEDVGVQLVAETERILLEGRPSGSRPIKERRQAHPFEGRPSGSHPISERY